MRDEEIKYTRAIANAMILVLRGTGFDPPAETSLPHRILNLCNEVERLDRACWTLAEDREALTKRVAAVLEENDKIGVELQRANAANAALRDERDGIAEATKLAIAARLDVLASQFPDDTIGNHCATLIGVFTEGLRK